MTDDPQTSSDPLEAVDATAEAADESTETVVANRGRRIVRAALFALLAMTVAGTVTVHAFPGAALAVADAVPEEFLSPAGFFGEKPNGQCPSQGSAACSMSCMSECSAMADCSSMSGACETASCESMAGACVAGACEADMTDAVASEEEATEEAEANAAEKEASEAEATEDADTVETDAAEAEAAEADTDETAAASVETAE